MNLTILGMGTALPPHSFSQTEAAELGRLICCQTDEQAALLRVMYRRAGVRNRHTVLPHRKALDWANLTGPNSTGTVLTGATATDNAAGAVDVVDGLGPTTRERMQFYEEHAGGLALKAAQAA